MGSKIEFMDRSQKANIKIAMVKGDIGGIKRMILQFFPESISDGGAPSWDSKVIPGGSHPLQMWQSGGGRTISFAVTLFRESLGSVNNAPAPAPIPSPGNFFQTAVQSAMGGADTITKVNNYNIDIDKALGWLRALTYPKYSDTAIDVPPQIRVIFPATMDLYKYLSRVGIVGNIVTGILKDAQIEYQKFFMDGTPKKASMTLTIEESCQDEQGIHFTGRM